MHGPGLNGDDIVEVLLLEPTGKELRTSPTPEEEAILLGEELEPLKAPEAAVSLPECLETPEPVEPTKQINALNTLHPLHQNPAVTLPGKERNPSEVLRLTQALPAIGSGPILRRAEGYLTG